MANNFEERRTGVFYRKMFWSAIGGGVILFFSLATGGYQGLKQDIKANAIEMKAIDNRNLDKEVFFEVIKRIDKNIEEIKQRLQK